MSTTYFAWTFPVRPSDLRGTYRGLDDVSPLMSTDIATGRVLMSASRNDWLAGIIVHIAPIFGTFAMSFLRNIVTPLDTDAMIRVSADIERLLSSAETSPSQFAGAICDANTAEDVIDALRLSVPARDPAKGPEGEEEGVGFIYLFAYLKSLLALFRYAQAHNLSVIHVRHEHPKLSTS